jgi:hypothetical protein
MRLELVSAVIVQFKRSGFLGHSRRIQILDLFNDAFQSVHVTQGAGIAQSVQQQVTD